MELNNLNIRTFEKQDLMLSSMTSNKTSLNSEEKLILESFKIGNPIKALEPEYVSAQIKAMMLRVTVITGCQLTADVSMRNVFYSELQKMLIESYSFLTFAEIEAAFRLAAAKGEANSYNNILNLQFIGNVLSDYKIKRGDTLKFTQTTSNALPAPKQELMSWEEITELEYQDYLNGKCIKGLIPEGIYNCLVSYGWVSPNAENKNTMQEWVVKFFYDQREAGVKNLFKQ